MQSPDKKEEPQEHFTPKISNFRQPMVTASGIFLGFMLNFAARWIGDAFQEYIVKDSILAICTTLSIAFLMTVLFRILNMNYPKENVRAYYQATLRLFIAGISLPFISFVLVLIFRLWSMYA